MVVIVAIPENAGTMQTIVENIAHLMMKEAIKGFFPSNDSDHS